MVGVKTAVDPLYVTAPAMADVPIFKLKVVVEKVSGSIGTLNVAATALVSEMPIALFNGYVTAPAMADVPIFKLKVVVEKVSGSIGTLNVAATALVSEMPIALFNGSVEITVGEVPVLNVHT